MDALENEERVGPRPDLESTRLGRAGHEIVDRRDRGFAREEPVQVAVEPVQIERAQTLEVGLSFLVQGRRGSRQVVVVEREGDRVQADEAFPGDIIGLHNHGAVQIGDTFTEGEELRFTGVPNFAPELFRRVRVRDPLKGKQLDKGLTQLSEEGATQVFRPLTRNEMIVGAVGVLQFDLVAFRLRDEYKADCVYEDASVYTARWVYCDDAKKLDEFRNKQADHLAIDGGGFLTYLAPSRTNLVLTEQRWPEIRFAPTREH